MLVFLIVNHKDTPSTHALSTHPPHIKNSPSAFIPFCEYNGDMQSVGEHDQRFPFPVCNAFTPTVLHGQLCYTFNPPDNDNNPTSDKPFLMFLLDYNEDRQINGLEDGEEVIDEIKTLHELKEDNAVHNEAMVYIHTLGKRKP